MLIKTENIFKPSGKCSAFESPDKISVDPPQEDLTWARNSIYDRIRLKEGSA